MTEQGQGQLVMKCTRKPKQENAHQEVQLSLG